jgi:hypothetical protein
MSGDVAMARLNAGITAATSTSTATLTTATAITTVAASAEPDRREAQTLASSLNGDPRSSTATPTSATQPGVHNAPVDDIDSSQTAAVTAVAAAAAAYTTIAAAAATSAATSVDVNRNGSSAGGTGVTWGIRKAASRRASLLELDTQDAGNGNSHAAYVARFDAYGL